MLQINLTVFTELTLLFSHTTKTPRFARFTDIHVIWQEKTEGHTGIKSLLPSVT